MEHGQSMNALGRENSFLMQALDSNNDVMSRRLKNRERQRRYRARKRLEADMKKGYTKNKSIPIQVNGIPNNFVSRIHCRRNWKKDARRAHAGKGQESISNNLVIAGLTLANGSGSQLSLLPSGAEANPPTESELGSMNSNSPALGNPERSATPGRRHWKADARSKILRANQQITNPV